MKLNLSKEQVEKVSVHLLLVPIGKITNDWLIMHAEIERMNKGLKEVVAKLNWEINDTENMVEKSSTETAIHHWRGRNEGYSSSLLALRKHFPKELGEK